MCNVSESCLKLARKKMRETVFDMKSMSQFGNLVLKMKSLNLSGSNDHEGHLSFRSVSGFRSSMQCAVCSLLLPPPAAAAWWRVLKFHLNNLKLSSSYKLGISWKLLTFYCALAALFCLFCSLSAWYSIVFVCLEFNYVLFILLRGIYWATLSNLNGLSSSSHCLAHFCYVSINLNQGDWLWFLVVAYNIHIIIVKFIEVVI